MVGTEGPSNTRPRCRSINRASCSANPRWQGVVVISEILWDSKSTYLAIRWATRFVLRPARRLAKSFIIHNAIIIKNVKGEGEPKGPDATTMKTKIGRKANAYTSKCAVKTKTSKSCHGKNKDCVQTQFDYVCGSERCSLHT